MSTAEVSTPDDLQEASSQEKLEEYQQANRELIQELARMSKGVSPAQAQSVLFDTFIDTFLSPEDKLALMINFEYRMGILLAQAVSNAKRQQLMEGVAGANLSLGK